MIAHNWTVLCSRSELDPETNGLSLFDILEEIYLIGPVLPPDKKLSVSYHCELVTSWVRLKPKGPDKGKVRVQVLAPQGTILSTFNYSVDLSSRERSYIITKISSISLQGAGNHTIRLHLQHEGENRWQLVAKILLGVLFEPSSARL